MKEIIKEVSKELSRRKIYHQIEESSIKTRKSEVKIPYITQEVAYLLGVVAGDGSLSMSKRKRGGYHYTFRVYSGDKNYLHYLNSIFNRIFQLRGKIIRDKRKEEAYYLVIKNAIIFFYFVKLGSEIGKKKLSNIPHYILKSEELLLHYLAGLVDTDGSIYANRIQLKQKSHSLLKEIREVLSKMGLNPSIPKVNYTNLKPFYYIRFDNKLPLRLK